VCVIIGEHYYWEAGAEADTVIEQQLKLTQSSQSGCSSLKQMQL